MFGTRTRRNPRTLQNDALLRELYRESNAYDHADGPVAVNRDANSARLGASAGNPNFVAQFDISILLRYFTVAAGVYTLTTAAAVFAAQPTLGTKLAAFLFGNSDFGGGFARLKALNPLSGWSYDAPFIYGIGFNGTTFGALDAVAKGQLQNGDLVIPATAVLGGVNYASFTIVRCTQVAYGTLLQALSSDQFRMNMVRYIMSDTTAVGLAQFSNNLNTFRQSLFGKNASDFVSPNSFKLPEQQQAGIIDIPLKVMIDKEAAIATMVNYDAVNVQLSLFVESVTKI